MFTGDYDGSCQQYFVSLRDDRVMVMTPERLHPFVVRPLVLDTLPPSAETRPPATSEEVIAAVLREAGVLETSKSR